MARVAGVDLPKQKRLDIALRYIYGIGPVLSNAIIKELNLEIQRMKQRECLDMMSAEIAELQFNDKVRKVLKEVAKKQYIKKYGKKSPGLS